MSQSVSQSVKKTYMEGTTSASSCTQTYHIQPSTCSSSRLTPYVPVALFEVKLQFVKVPVPRSRMQTAPPCKQVTRTNQPHTHTQTHTQTTVSPSMLACIHSIRHLLSITRSQERTNHVSPLPFITIIHPSINHALHGTTQYGIRTCTHHVVMARTQWNVFATTLERDTHIYMHACMEMRTTRMMMMVMVMMPLPCSSNPLNLLMSIFGGGDRGGDDGGGSIDCRVDVDAAASLMLSVDS